MLKKNRFLIPKQHQVQVTDGIRYCRYCKTKPLVGRRTSFCSQECSHEFALRMNGSYARHHVELRDHGVCSKCGIDTQKLKRIMGWLGGRASDQIMEAFYQDKIPHTDIDLLKEKWKVRSRPWLLQLEDETSLRFFKNHLASIGFNKKHLWEADHIKPVVFGGGEAGLSNLRTLCVPCHKGATKILRQAMVGRKKSADPKTYWGRDR